MAKVPLEEQAPEALHGRQTVAASAHGGKVGQIIVPEERENTSLDICRQ
jgi:hypothetical protein